MTAFEIRNIFCISECKRLVSTQKWKLRVCSFSYLDEIPACDIRMDRQTDRHCHGWYVAYLCCSAVTRSPAVARMSDRTAPVVKPTITLTGHNLPIIGTFPLNGPIMRQNEAHQAIFCTLKNYFRFYISTSGCVISNLETNRKWSLSQ